MATSLQSPMRMSNHPMSSFILAFILLALATYTYKIYNQYNHRAREMVDLKEKFLEAVFQKNNYEKRSQHCMLRVQEMEDLKKAADDGRLSIVEAKKSCEHALFKQKEITDKQRTEMHNFVKAITGALGEPEKATVKELQDKIKTIKGNVEVDKKVEEIKALQKELTEVKEKLKSCSATLEEQKKQLSATSKEQVKQTEKPAVQSTAKPAEKPASTKAPVKEQAKTEPAANKDGKDKKA